MPAAETIAKLNQMGGKSEKSQASRFRPRLSGMFSPEKSTKGTTYGQLSGRMSGRLLQKRLSQPGVPSGRRNSLSFPDEDETIETPAPKAKKKVGLKSKNVDKRSPMKKLGFDLTLQDNPKVNLADSPAKNTRSRNGNPLETLMRANLPIPEAYEKERHIRVETIEQRPLPAPETPNTGPRKRKARRTSGIEPSAGSNTRSAKRARITTQDEDGVEERDQSVERVGNTEPNEEEPDTAAPYLNNKQSTQSTNVPTVSLMKRPRGRPLRTESRRSQEELPRNLANDSERNYTDQASQAGAKAQSTQVGRLQSSKEVAAEEQARFNKFRERYAKDIEEAIKVNHCTEVWKNLGASTYTISAQILHQAAPESERGKNVLEQCLKLDKYYEGARKAPSEKQERKIAGAIEVLENRCSLLTPSEGATETGDADRLVVRDMFRIIIPKLVFVLKSFLLARYRNKSFTGSAVTELTHLLQIAIGVCDRARLWRPQPSTLEDLMKKSTRNGMLANLKYLENAFKWDVTVYQRIENDRIAIRDLHGRQIAAIQAQQQRLRAFKRNPRRFHREEETIESPRQEVRSRRNPDAAVYDIDEVDEDQAAVALHPDPRHLQHSKRHIEKAKEGRPRLVRESTADLTPPLPISMSEDEKMALLNGLQRYTGEHRYSEILNDPVFGSVLGKRDLDDLIKIARSFSQMMASKLGLEEYRNDKAYAWLWSTDPEILG